MGGYTHFVTIPRFLQPVAPAAHVIGQLHVPFAAPDAHPLTGPGIAPLRVEQGQYEGRAARGGYARAPVDMAFVPEPRTPRAANRVGAGVQYGVASAYGAGLVNLPSKCITCLRSRTVWPLTVCEAPHPVIGHVRSQVHHFDRGELLDLARADVRRVYELRRR